MKKSLIFNACILLVQLAMFFLPWKWILTKFGHVNEDEIYLVVFLVIPLLLWISVAQLIASVQENLFSHDENKCYSAFVSSSPMMSKGQVLSKYYEMLLLSFVLLVWGEVCDYALCVVNNMSGETLGIRLCLFFLQLFLRAVETPFLVRYGSKSGKQVKLLVLLGAAFFVIVYLLFGPLPDSNNIFDTIVKWFSSNDKLSGALLGVAAILPYMIFVLYYISYRISCRLYQRGVETYEV
jgi:hypothetical protein